MKATFFLLIALVSLGCISLQKRTPTASERYKELYINNGYTYTDGQGNRHFMSRHHYTYTPQAKNTEPDTTERAKKEWKSDLSDTLFREVADGFVAAFKQGQFHTLQNTVGAPCLEIVSYLDTPRKFYLRAGSAPHQSMNQLMRKIQLQSSNR